ncbi:SGNH/GDSL hydrolase family protein [Fundidesulfovibrio soli]|uniref:SGNH/GDSL hydrolase family protein n=1 Tax=Fundidesulfovibrio soli TaxID=2922716 RepID=UPI001FAF0A04|nr:SGNH/GDSL hydrolase family protein [Fundidesulfovibrio soli]
MPPWDATAYPGALAELLGAATGGQVEVINAGVPAHTSLQFLLRLQEEIIPLSPDLVLLGDGFDNILLAASLAQHPWLDLPERRDLADAAHRLYLLDELTTPLLRLSSVRKLRDASRRLFPGPVWHAPASAEAMWRYGLEKYVAHTSLTVETLLRAGIMPVLVNFPVLQARGSIFNLSADKVAMLEFIRGELNDANRALASRSGVPLVDASAEMAGYLADPCGQFALFSDYIHFSNQGYVQLADVLARGILANPACRQALGITRTPDAGSMEARYREVRRAIASIAPASGFVTRPARSDAAKPSFANVKPGDADQKGWRPYEAKDAALPATIGMAPPEGGWSGGCLLFYPRGSSPQGRVEVRAVDGEGSFRPLAVYSPATRAGAWTNVGDRHLIDLPEEVRGQRIEVVLIGDGVQVWGDAGGVLFEPDAVGKLDP